MSLSESDEQQNLAKMYNLETAKAHQVASMELLEVEEAVRHLLQAPSDGDPKELDEKEKLQMAIGSIDRLCERIENMEIGLEMTIQEHAALVEQLQLKRKMLRQLFTTWTSGAEGLMNEIKALEDAIAKGEIDEETAKERRKMLEHLKVLQEQKEKLMMAQETELGVDELTTTTGVTPAQLDLSGVTPKPGVTPKLDGVVSVSSVKAGTGLMQKAAGQRLEVIKEDQFREGLEGREGQLAPEEQEMAQEMELDEVMGEEAVFREEPVFTMEVAKVERPSDEFAMLQAAYMKEMETPSETSAYSVSEEGGITALVINRATLGDFEFLKKSIGKPLTEALVQCCLHQPKDKIQYIAGYLLFYRQKYEMRIRQKELDDQLRAQRQILAAELAVPQEMAPPLPDIQEEGFLDMLGSDPYMMGIRNY